MKYKRPTKATIKAFRKAAEECLQSLGAERSPPGTQREYTIRTNAGALLVDIQDSWLACIFEDVRKARELLPSGCDSRLNPHSGKWNWMNGEDDLHWFQFEVRALQAAMSRPADEELTSAASVEESV